MPKLKSNKSLKRRFKLTGTGKLMAYPSGKRHLLGSRNAKTKRRLRKPLILKEGDARRLRALLG